METERERERDDGVQTFVLEEMAREGETIKVPGTPLAMTYDHLFLLLFIERCKNK